ncbi:MAG: YetF domain-containing protein [Pseudomonadota bacterium]
MLDISVPWWELVVRGIVVYVFLILLLRITGKRQIGQLSPFDLVLLLILSNAVQNSMNAGDDSLIGGLIVATTLVAVNYLIGLIAFKSKKLEVILEGRPQVIIHHGKLFEDVMDEAKLTRNELDSTLRQSGYFEIKDVRLAILENNGTVTVQGYDKKQQQ